MYLKIDKINVDFQGMYYKRCITSVLKEALKVFLVVALLEEKQIGKNHFSKEEFKSRTYLRLSEKSLLDRGRGV